MTKARNQEVTRETQRQSAAMSASGWYHSFHFPDGEVAQGHQTEDQMRFRIAQFPIPADLRGKRVLDIGTWDGWFSFEMERRGAEVVAVDTRIQPGLLRAKEKFGSRIEIRVDDVVDLTPEKYGTFDIVLFLGVLYHLRHPLLALERVCALSRDMVCVESYVTDGDLSAPPLMEFYENTELCGQFDNWIGPNLSCLMAFCRTAGFARVQFESVHDQRAHVTCYRTWGERIQSAPAPKIVAVDNSLGGGTHFTRRADEFVSIWFKTGEPVQPGNVYPMVGDAGVRAISLQATGDTGWHVDVPLPPGLADGSYPVRIAVGNSSWSNSLPVFVGIEAPVGSSGKFDPAQWEINIVADGKSWERDLVRRTAEPWLSVWLKGLPEEAVPMQVSARIGEREFPASFLSPVDEAGLRQANFALSPDLAVGEYRLAVTYRDATTPERPLRGVLPDA